MFFNQVLMILS